MRKLSERASLASLDGVALLGVLALQHAEFVRLTAAPTALVLVLLIFAGSITRGLSVGFSAALASGFCHPTRNIIQAAEKSKPSCQHTVGKPHSAALAIGLVEEYRGGAADVQRIYFERHRNGDRFIAGVEHCGRDAVAFAAEDDATVLSEMCLRECRARVRMRGYAPNTAGA